MKRNAAKIFPWLIAILLPLFAIYPALTTPIEERSYDAATFHVYRGVLFSDARAQGVFFPRWIPQINAGLGGPLFTFYSPATFFALDALNSLGVPQPIGWRILIALGLIAASVGVFAFARSWDVALYPSFAASVLFVYAFPFLRELFERGSPEGFAIALYPWVLWSLTRLIQNPNGLWLGVAAILWSFVILTHNLSALLLIPLIALIVIIQIARHGWRRLGFAALALILGILLAAFFVFPFLAERDAIQFANAFEIDYAQIARNAFDLIDLLRLPPAYDLGLDNNFIGDHLGALSGAILGIGLICGLIKSPRSSAFVRVRLILMAFFACAIIWLQTDSANWVWNTLTFLSLIQIRTRLLGLVVLCVAIVGGLLLTAISSRWQTLTSTALIALTILIALPVMYPQLQYRYAMFATQPAPQDAMTFALAHNVPGLTAFNEFLPIWRTQSFTPEEARLVAASVVANAPDSSRVLNETRRATETQVQIDSPIPFTMIFRQMYFPGWVGYIDDKPVSIQPIPGSGYVQMENVPAGAHTLSLRYRGTPVETISALISIVTLIGLLVTMGLSLFRNPIKIGDAETSRFSWRFLGVFVMCCMIKITWLDPQTTLLRANTNCANPRARFGENILLCRIDFDHAIKPGDMIHATLYWQTTTSIQMSTESFVHLYGATFNPKTNTPLWGQQDKQAPGYHAITTWMPGKMYRDDYDFQIDPDAPPGDYQLEVGWWQSNAGQRLAPKILLSSNDLSLTANDSLLLSGITVK